jgi:hypothetical protein
MQLYSQSAHVNLSFLFYTNAVSAPEPGSFSFRPGLDILSGRGETIKINNSFFTQLIHEYSPLYVSSRQAKAKRAVASHVIERVRESEGRFLDKHGSELPYKATVEKVMKALKDHGLKMRRLTLRRAHSPIPDSAISDVPPKPPATISTATPLPPLTVQSALRVNRSYTILAEPVDPAQAVQLNLEPLPLKEPVLHSFYFEPLRKEAPPNDPIWQDTLFYLNRLVGKPSTLS